MKNHPIHLTTDDYLRLTGLLYTVELQPDHDPMRTRLLRQKLTRAVVVPSYEIPYQTITMHSEFLLKDLDTGGVRAYTLAYPDEAPGRNTLSVMSPAGGALLGRQDLDEVAWEGPAGRTRCRVEAVLFQPEAAGASRVLADSLIPGSRRAA